MSVKQITLSSIGAILLGLFIVMLITDAAKQSDKLEIQNVELETKTFQINQLQTKEQKLNQELEKAEETKSSSQEELNKLKQQQEELEKQKRELESQLQAKLKQKSSIALAANKAANLGVSTASATSGESIYAIIVSAANKYGINPDEALRIAKCESTYNPQAVNYKYTDPTTGTNPAGLFQHVQGYWAGRAAKHGYAGASVFDPVANANVTMSMWATGSKGLWECQ